MLANFATLAQMLSVVAGVVISVLSFNYTHQVEAEARKVESAKEFLQLRQKYYTEALEIAAVLVNPESHTPEQIETAKKAFRELYVVRLSMVETPEVERKMVALAAQIDKELLNFTPAQKAAYELARTLSTSFSASYQLEN